MAKRQNFIVGSTNPVTVSKTTTQLNNGWNKYEVLKAGDLDGVFNAVSDYSGDSSNEIANAILALTGSQPTGADTSELAGALNQMRQDIETSSLTFKGYISTTQPSASDYAFKVGDIWIQSATLPTLFPVAIAGIWDGTQWASTTETYTQQDFDFFRNINDGEGYYWFGGEWKVMSTDMSTTYFTLNQTSGKWEIKDSVNLPGAPTAATPTSDSLQTQIANKNYVDTACAGFAATSLNNLTTTGKANISTLGTFDNNENYASGSVGAAIKSKATSGHEIIASQEPTAQNNYTWYRKYADGWVEQGGVRVGSVSIPSGGEGTFGDFIFPVVMANTDYTAIATGGVYVFCMNVTQLQLNLFLVLTEQQQEH